MNSSLMIDWLSLLVTIRHRPFDAGTIVSLNAGGVLEWETMKYYKVEGSHDTSIQVRSQGHLFDNGDASQLYISGNPSKFLLGHNVYGSSSIIRLVFVFVCRLFSDTDRPLHKIDLKRLLDGQYEVKTIDINSTFDVGSALNVRQWLDAAAMQSRTRHGTPTTAGSTVYWGKNSRRYAIKAYDKNKEVNSRSRKHRLAESIPLEHRLLVSKWSEGKIRIELRMHSKELKKAKVNVAKYLTETKLHQLFNDYVSNIDMSTQVNLTDDKIECLPKRIRGTYLLWKEGFNVQTALSKATFYRHKKELNRYGVDISLPNPSARDRNNVIPMMKIIDLKPASLPDFALDEIEKLNQEFLKLATT